MHSEARKWRDKGEDALLLQGCELIPGKQIKQRASAAGHRSK